MLPENPEASIHVEDRIGAPACPAAMIAHRTQLSFLGVRLRGQSGSTGHRGSHLPPVIQDLRNVVDIPPRADSPQEKVPVLGAIGLFTPAADGTNVLRGDD